MRHDHGMVGAEFTYDACWQSVTLTADDGTPNATISATTYLADLGETAKRPVMFLSNGGPGASSSPLHLSAFGPRRLTRAADAAERFVQPNPHSLLDVADLVFIDPVGTGFSRELREGGNAPYLSVHGDASAVEQLIRGWLDRHGRAASPVYLVGESYGGFRLATLCERIGDLNVAGLVFISPMLDASGTAAGPGNDLPYVFELPTMAVAAWHHGRAADDAADAATVFGAAREFAGTEYLQALHQGSALPASQREALAERLASLTGLPAKDFLAASLRIDGEVFLRSLLADRAELVSRLDTRITGPLTPRPEGGRPAAADDPALGMQQRNTIVSDSVGRYLRTEAEAGSEEPYISLSLDINFAFDWRPAGPSPAFYRNATAHVADLMRQRPGLRVQLLGGYFDLATPLSAALFALQHSGVPADRVDVRPVNAGHSLSDDTTLIVASGAIRDLLHATS